MEIPDNPLRERVMFAKSLLTAAAASWSLTSLGGAMVHVPILVSLSPLVWVAALVAFGWVFRFLPSPEGGRGVKKAASVATFFLGAAAIVAASGYAGSVLGDAIDAAQKKAFGMRLAAVNSVPAAGAMIVASAVFAMGVRLRTRWPLATICAVGVVYALGIAGIAFFQSFLPLNA